MTSADWLSALRRLYPPDRVVTDAAELTRYESDAQGVTAAPRQLLRAIPNVTLLEISQSEICCGSAGTYNRLVDTTHWAGLRSAESKNAYLRFPPNSKCTRLWSPHSGAVR